MATAVEDGRCDASPKGDPPGELVHVLDRTTIAIAERPGNRRADGYKNLLRNPHVGLNFFIPGRGDTLRINGRATLVSDARSEEHTSELQSLMRISYAVFCLKKKTNRMKKQKNDKTTLRRTM